MAGTIGGRSRQLNQYNIMSNFHVRHVDHTYKDFSHYVERGGELIVHKKSDRNFPAKVHAMLSDPSNSEIVTWMVSCYPLVCKYSECIPSHVLCVNVLTDVFMSPFFFQQPHGRAWMVLNKDEFLSSVLPQYLVCKKYDSFTRQLNGW